MVLHVTEDGVAPTRAKFFSSKISKVRQNTSRPTHLLPAALKKIDGENEQTQKFAPKLDRLTDHKNNYYRAA